MFPVFCILVNLEHALLGGCWIESFISKVIMLINLRNSDIMLTLYHNLMQFIILIKRSTCVSIETRWKAFDIILIDHGIILFKDIISYKCRCLST